jgi:DNA-binding transcriptional ArsR family regulator
VQTDIAERGLAALGDATRRRIVERLAAGPCAVGDIARSLPVGRPAVSMHLRVLQEAGLVRHERAGNRRLYHLDPQGLAVLRAYMDAYWSHALRAFEMAAFARQKGQPVAVESELSVLKTVVVPLPLVEAFALFVQQDKWWPVATHHIAEPPGVTAVLEPFLGGRWFERCADGREQEWGRVLVWRPPHQIVLSWQVSSDWTFEPDPARASEIDVRFLAEAPDRTRLEYEHRHLERYGEHAERMRAGLEAPNAAQAVVNAYAASVRVR